MQPNIKYILLICLLCYSLEYLEDYYKCPENHFLKYTGKQIICPTGALTSNDDYCEKDDGSGITADSNSFYDVEKNEFRAYPDDYKKAYNLDGTVKDITGVPSNKFNTDGFGYHYGQYIYDNDDNDNAYRLKKRLTSNGTLIEPEYPPCTETQFLNKTSGKCQPCNNYTDSNTNKTYYFYSIGGYSENCKCKKYGSDEEFFWNKDTGKCESCHTLGSGKDTDEYDDYIYKCYCLDGDWNSDLKQCISSPSCSSKRQVVNPKTNLCEDCPDDSYFHGSWCFCKDKTKTFDSEKLKCVKINELEKYNSHNYFITQIYQGSKECREGYPYNSHSKKCTSCPKGSSSSYGTCICPAGKYWDSNAFDCLECPENSRLGTIDGIYDSESDICPCKIGFVKRNGTCVSCPANTTYNNFGHNCKINDESYADSYYYSDFYNQVFKEPATTGSEVMVDEYACIPCPENSYYDSRYSICVCVEYGSYYDKETNTCKKTRITDDKSPSSFLRLSLFFFSLLLLIL